MLTFAPGDHPKPKPNAKKLSMSFAYEMKMKLEVSGHSEDIDTIHIRKYWIYWVSSTEFVDHGVIIEGNVSVPIPTAVPGH